MTAKDIAFVSVVGELEEPNGPVKIGMTTGQSKTGRAGGAPGLPLE